MGVILTRGHQAGSSLPSPLVRYARAFVFIAGRLGSFLPSSIRILRLPQSNVTALLGEAALFIPGYECDSPVAPSDFDRLVSGYRLTQTALLWGPLLQLEDDVSLQSWNYSTNLQVTPYYQDFDVSGFRVVNRFVGPTPPTGH